MNKRFTLPGRLALPFLLLMTATVFGQPDRNEALASEPNEPEPNYDQRVVPNPDSFENTQLASAFLLDLLEGQFERAHSRLTTDFRAYVLPANQDLNTDAFLASYDCAAHILSKQHLKIGESFSFMLPGHAGPEAWVYQQMTWLVSDQGQPNKRIQREQYYLLQVRHDKLTQLYCGENKHLLFFQLGLTYSGLTSRFPDLLSSQN